MRELINAIPFFDIVIIGLLLLFLYLGWANGTPRLLMVIGSIYTGLLLASVYYHLFAVLLAQFLNIRSMFVADLLSFIALTVLITIVMLALLFSLFGHIEVKSRMAVFDKITGTVLGLLAGVLVVGILVTLLRVPYESNKVNSVNEMPAVQVFNNGYEKSMLAPVFVRGAPYFLASMKPMLPPQVQARGAVPLLESFVAYSE
ncbi:MAG TPA: CvpA family protein [Chloroflexia bacterium]|nr:CvpA family protein [Chloroflexia bacterium]